MTIAVHARPPRRHPLAKMYYRLRTRRDTPRQKALAVWLGTVVGCTPLFGLHLPMCIALARLTGLNIVTTYLASYINNPLVAPFTLYLALAVGRWIFNGHWPALNVDEAPATSVWHVGRDVLVGSLIVGLVFGACLAGIVYRFSRNHADASLARRLSDVTAHRYLTAGVFWWEFVRGKLRFDSLYLWLLKANILPRRGRLIDLGCRRGVLLCLLINARKLYLSETWEADWPPPPTELALVGIEQNAANAAVARSAVGLDVELRAENLLTAELPSCEVVSLLDVLVTLAPHEQQTLIARVAAVLKPGGLLLIRETDADAGIRFTMTRLAKRAIAWCQGNRRQPFQYRGSAAWITLLESHGFRATIRAMPRRTFFSNVLIEARKA